MDPNSWRGGEDATTAAARVERLKVCRFPSSGIHPNHLSAEDWGYLIRGYDDEAVFKEWIARIKPYSMVTYDGLVSPGFRVPVYHPDTLYSKRPEIVVVLAWRFAQAIMQNHARYQQEGGTFVVPVPSFQKTQRSLNA